MPSGGGMMKILARLATRPAGQPSPDEPSGRGSGDSSCIHCRNGKGDIQFWKTAACSPHQYGDLSTVFFNCAPPRALPPSTVTSTPFTSDAPPSSLPGTSGPPPRPPTCLPRRRRRSNPLIPPPRPEALLPLRP